MRYYSRAYIIYLIFEYSNTNVFHFHGLKTDALFSTFFFWKMVDYHVNVIASFFQQYIFLEAKNVEPHLHFQSLFSKGFLKIHIMDLHEWEEACL